jgi:hypothetical protein
LHTSYCKIFVVASVDTSPRNDQHMAEATALPNTNFPVTLTCTVRFLLGTCLTLESKIDESPMWLRHGHSMCSCSSSHITKTIIRMQSATAHYHHIYLPKILHLANSNTTTSRKRTCRIHFFSSIAPPHSPPPSPHLSPQSPTPHA